MTKMLLEVKNLFVSSGNKQILKGINLSVKQGAIHLLSGHNGSGKSTLVNTIAGNPEYKIDSGEIFFNGKDITNETTTNRALMGIFLGAQNVPEIPGLSILSFLKHSLNAHANYNDQQLIMKDFLSTLETNCKKLNIPKEWLNRHVNVGFSGGERKRIMLLQLLLTKPKLAILDEPDSGTDIELQKQIVTVIKEMTDTSFLFISHQNNFISEIKPTEMTVLNQGTIKKE